MRLVDNHKIDVGLLPAGQRLDRADLHGLGVIRQFVVALYHADAVDPLYMESGDRLIDERQRGDDEGDAVTFVEGALDDVRRQERLAGAVGA
jgi:hypothetical protein